MLILVFGAFASIALGQALDASIILAIVIGSTLLGFAQERAKRMTLWSRSSPTQCSRCFPAPCCSSRTSPRAMRCAFSRSTAAACAASTTTLEPGQANDAFILPGVALGTVASGASRVTEDMFHAAARALAAQVGDRDLAAAAVATAVSEAAYAARLASLPRPGDIEAQVRAAMYRARYPEAGDAGDDAGHDV